MIQSVPSLLFSLFVLFLPVQAWAFAYAAPELEGRVVDSDTHQPLEGVNVVAHWVLNFGAGQQTDLMLMEAVTDHNGHYFFPAWGPLPIPATLPPETRMKFQDPEIIYFKSAYTSTSVGREITGPHADYGAPVRTSQWNHRTIELKKFNGTLEQYAFEIGGVLTGVSYGSCNWKRIPRVIVALTKEKERLRRLGIYSSVPTIRKIEDISVGEGCGSVEAFFREYLR